MSSSFNWNRTNTKSMAMCYPILDGSWFGIFGSRLCWLQINQWWESSWCIFDLVDYNLIASTRWLMCFHKWLDSNSALEELTFGGNNIDDEGAVMLVDLIAWHMNTVLTHLLLSGSSITDDAWRTFTEVLLPSSAWTLKELVTRTLQ